jgi:hypothetical protein
VSGGEVSRAWCAFVEGLPLPESSTQSTRNEIELVFAAVRAG